MILTIIHFHHNVHGFRQYFQGFCVFWSSSDQTPNVDLSTILLNIGKRQMSESVALLAQIGQAPKTIEFNKDNIIIEFNKDNIKGNDTNDHAFWS